MRDELKNLRFIRLTNPHLVPRYLVEQIKHREYTVEAFYKFNENNLLMPPDAGHLYNPLNHLYLIVNDDNESVGFLWFMVDPLTHDITIQNFSIDPKLWHKGEAIELVKDFVSPIRDKAQLNKIYWITHHPKQAKRHGFEPTKAVLMEYKGEENEPRGKITKDLTGGSTETGADTVSSEHVTGDGVTGSAGVSELSAASES